MRIRCPECDALVTTGAAWCPQCFAELREPERGTGPEHGPGPGTEPAAGPVPDAAPGAPASRRARHRAADDETTPGWPCPSCGTVNDLAAGACATCGEPFLAGLAADRGVPVLPRLEALSRGARIGAALAAVAGVLVVLAVLFWLVG
ncbi:MAG TPA: zinc ribbon domain-containing protein [Mycobacteriales bacterium]